MHVCLCVCMCVCIWFQKMQKHFLFQQQFFTQVLSLRDVVAVEALRMA